LVFLPHGVNAAGPSYPYVKASISSIERSPDGFLINGFVVADGPHDRPGIYDEYSLWVEIIIKNGSNARYPNIKEWAYEQASIDYYYPGAETTFVPGSGPGKTMTKEEAYGINVTIITLFSSSNLGSYNFSAVVPYKYEGKEFRILATLQWDFTGVNAFWWAHRFVNKIAGEGVLGSNYKFIYSDGVIIKYSDGSTDNKFSWKSDWPREGNISFQFTKPRSYLALPGASLVGDESVSGEITKDKIIIKKNLSDVPLEFTSLYGDYKIAGEGEVSIVVKTYDKNGSLVYKGWGNLTDEYVPPEWERSVEWSKKMLLKLANYVNEHKIEILFSSGAGIFIKVTTGVPGFLLTLPTKYIARALGYLSVYIPQYLSQYEPLNTSTNISSKKFDIICHSDVYIISKENYTGVYVAEGNVTVVANNTINVISGEFLPIYNGTAGNKSIFTDDEMNQFEVLKGSLWEHQRMAKVDSFILCKGIDANGNAIDETTSFSTKNTVYALLHISNASDGDIVSWVFEGPNSITKEINYTVNWSGDGICYAWLSIQPYGEKAIGMWNVTALLNNEIAAREHFEVKKQKSIPGFGVVATILALLILWRRKWMRF